MYSRTLYGASVVLAEVPWLAFFAMLFTAIFTPMAQFTMLAGPFFTYYVGALLTMGGFLYGGIAASVLLPSAVIAQIAGGAFLAVIWLFAYVFVPWGYLPAWWRWFSLVDFAAHCVRAIATTEFYCSGAGCPTIDVPTASGLIPTDTYGYISGLVGSTYEAAWPELGIAAAIVVGMAAGAAIAHNINWQKR
jgi:Zn-dependent protease with chaperone function